MRFSCCSRRLVTASLLLVLVGGAPPSSSRRSWHAAVATAAPQQQQHQQEQVCENPEAAAAVAAAAEAAAEAEAAEAAGTPPPAMTPHRRSAVVVGGTGAVGHHIVEQLLASSAWQSVTTVGRRACPLPAGTAGADKLTQCVVADMGALQDAPAARDAFGSADAVFCALGTTRGDAGSAEAFRRVDYEYVAAAAAAAKAGGRAAWFGLVSAQGANANVPAWDWPRLLHPLLYTQTKGRAENACTGQGFGRTAIFRPGMIDRGDRARGVERAFSFLGSIPAADIARAMVADAEAYLASPPSSALAQQQQQQQQQGGVAAAVAVVEGNAAIKRLAAEAARAAAATTAQ